MTRLALIASAILIAPSAMAQVTDHSAHEGHAQAEQPPTPKPEDHSTMDHSKMDHGATRAEAGHAGGHAMLSAFGPYASTRDASGTS